MLSQKKIELAVLYKLFTIAESNLPSATPEGIREAFKGYEVSKRRVEVALHELFALGHAESVPDPHVGIYRWHLTKEGYEVVDRALRVTNSFIARFAKSGDQWLSTEEAEKAVLNKLNQNLGGILNPVVSSNEADRASTMTPITINNNFSPEVTSNATVKTHSASGNGIEWASWTNALIALAIGASGILATLWVAGKI